MLTYKYRKFRWCRGSRGSDSMISCSPRSDSLLSSGRTVSIPVSPSTFPSGTSFAGIMAFWLGSISFFQESSVPNNGDWFASRGLRTGTQSGVCPWQNQG
ncbi:hypothetical protein RvY_05174 [Ramazzottius varieornatus]|uniref:Uncharacterized protein n=1 Tax=Ramazzottius varieornatus TaxID=947166 RepID=A0A1D1UUR8_RAMVA|nr:hypothetical protein RvY_05174 [Ramazzottius varieornatus]